MKRQLGPVVAVLVLLLCVPAAWSQNGFTDSPLSASADQTQSGSTPSDSGQSDSGGIPQAAGLPKSDSGSSPQSYSGSSSQSSTEGPQATFSHPEQLPPLT